jgi:beta-lactamase class A
LKGWQRINNNWYYFDTDQTWALKDWQLINGTWYYFDPQNCWLDYQPTLDYAWRSIINQYSNPVAIAIQSQATNQVYTYTNVAGHTFDTASTVKVAVLAELLHNTGGSLTWQQQQLAAKMIRNSDNDATTYIVNNYLGGLGGLRSIYSALGMNSTSIGPTWGKTKTTPADQLKLLAEIYLKPSSTYLNNQSRQYIQQLMGSVSASQNWGISAGSGSFYVKNGWRPDNGWWHVNSIGFIPGSQNDGYTIAVYTDSNTSMNNGINLIERLARATRTIMI